LRAGIEFCKREPEAEFRAPFAGYTDGPNHRLRLAFGCGRLTPFNFPGHPPLHASQKSSCLADKIALVCRTWRNKTTIPGAMIAGNVTGRTQMLDGARDVACRLFSSQSGERTWRLMSIALVALGVGATVNMALPQPAAPPPEEEEYGEFLARPEELASVAVNDIVKSIRMNGTAMVQGRKVYEKNCAACHGADLKGIPDQHTPDLTDAEWQYSGDDLPSGGLVKFPSDVEWTVRYGIRSGHPNGRGEEADMLAYDPQYRTAEDTKEFGDKAFLTPEEIEDVVEYVLELSGQQADAAKAERGNVLFHDGAKGNCYDCHTDEGTGNPALGSTNLTQKRLYLYGADRASILESITRGRRGVMPAFEGNLKPEEIKAVSVYVFSREGK
jgi:mono/diheme cytochrome c family protein